MTRSSIELLRGMPIFGGLSDSALELILQASTMGEISAGDYLFREGDAAASVFVLHCGSVTIEKTWQGQSITLGQLAAGDCIGEMAMIDFQPRSASVLADTDCQFIEIPPSSLRELLKNDLEQYAMIMMNMGREVSRRLRLADERIMLLEQQQQQQ